MQEITSTSNLTIKSDAKLSDKKHRDETGLFVVEGRKLIIEGVKSGYRLVRLYIDSEKLKDYSDLADEFSEKAIMTTSFCIDKLSDAKTSQGIIGIFEKGREPLSNKYYRALILENLQDPKNVGTLIRTATACDFVDIYLIDSADPFSPKGIRASMSGVFKCNVIECDDVTELREKLRGNAVFSADMEGENVFSKEMPSSSVAIVLGNEGNGLSEQMKSFANEIVSIPMSGGLESLNVATSGAILMYEIARKTF